MKMRLLYFIASILAFVAAGLNYFMAEAGQDVALKVAVPLVIGLVMLVLGLRHGREMRRT